MGKRRVRTREAVGEAEAAGFVADRAEVGRTAVVVERTVEAGVVKAAGTRLAAGDVTLLEAVVVAVVVVAVEAAALKVGLRSEAGDASLDGAGLVALEEIGAAGVAVGAVAPLSAAVAVAAADVVDAALRAARLLTAILDGGISGIATGQTQAAPVAAGSMTTRQLRLYSRRQLRNKCLAMVAQGAARIIDVGACLLLITRVADERKCAERWMPLEAIFCRYTVVV